VIFCYHWAAVDNSLSFWAGTSSKVTRITFFKNLTNICLVFIKSGSQISCLPVRSINKAQLNLLIINLGVWSLVIGLLSRLYLTVKP
jgi:hypothetical protein